ncbi:MAG: hypothetical protein A2504_16675 [Bdellovibrionales bacterium RIFOXYD12_FULL_39_22]|nr:MAG: hypothetical protein A2385_14530 [Bdellovibrionales bacterium RIFOXYB1_FULL_39_21]OFZ45005.1 MAG: hypothetical protein A2485_13955 [Bdellovibrionales bacterium RIFOXYC12_FULL_39_17]OFZ49443.1 MAG: hypothetical protein A2404_08440 [Bdellovibrionales bacterium RIFOXYC1_FULL_39_130]OFZ73277.1 MAG: hypothetical protein A2451_07605 [Bdellovibrionales bacterium RIFOXYC2_FULL_39_8]OFZ77182.1 MAG: hypothetical protein A2560_07965 [Bdellovibrionales bacterium RIFOXYD1_FULL_39_84]OFZ95627.1 MAG:
MSMQAQINIDARGDITVKMEGGLNFENTVPLRAELESLKSQNPNSTITLDMNNIDFVGSSGIGVFVETIKAMNSKRQQIKLQNVKSEFLKVFKLFNLDAMELIVKEFENDETEFLNQNIGNRKQTFQN